MSRKFLQALLFLVFYVLYSYAADSTEITDELVDGDVPFEDDDQDQESNDKVMWSGYPEFLKRDPVEEKDMKCGGRKGGSKYVEVFNEVKCGAHLTIVRVGNPYGGIRYEPAYIKVKRCIGKAPARTKCAPRKNYYSYRNVKVQKYIGDTGKEECVVPIREDDRCRLTCIKSQSSCTSGEIFDTNLCTCKSKSG